MCAVLLLLLFCFVLVSRRPESLKCYLQRLNSTCAAQNCLRDCGLVKRFIIKLSLHCHFGFQNWEIFSPSPLKNPSNPPLNYSQPNIDLKEQHEIIHRASSPTNLSRLFLSPLIANYMLLNVKMQQGPIKNKCNCLQGTL